MLIEAGAALQRGDAKTYVMRDREFYENVAGQSGNSARIEALARVAMQIQLCGTMKKRKPGVCRARLALRRRHHTSIQGPRYSARRLSGSRPHQPYPGGDPCELSR
jgi:hypothetical protein